MIYMRGQRATTTAGARWAMPAGRWDDVLPYFKKHQDRGAAPTPSRTCTARGGEWRIERPRIRWKVLDLFQDAAEQFGIPKIDDFNRGNNEGSGYFHVNQRRGVRWSAARAFSTRSHAGRT